MYEENSTNDTNDLRASLTEALEGKEEKEEEEERGEDCHQDSSQEEQISSEKLKVSRDGLSYGDLCVQLDTARDNVKKARDQLLRVMAEAENFKKRAEKEKEDIRRFAISSFVRDILPVWDSLKRALEVTNDKKDDKTANNIKPCLCEEKTSVNLDTLPVDSNEDVDMDINMDDVLYQGISLTLRELEQVFARHMVVKIEPCIGDKLDPYLHEAMFEMPSADDAVQSGCVAQIVEIGYKLKDRVLRPARVGIAIARK